MKTLTIHQPWAWLIINAYKLVENRRWSTKYRGPLAIHAGARRGAERQGWLSDELLDQLRAAGYPIPDVDQLRFSAIVGTVELVDVVPYPGNDTPMPANATDQWSQRLCEFAADPYGLKSDRFARGPKCWILADARALDEPIPCSGNRGLWTYAGEIA